MKYILLVLSFLILTQFTHAETTTPVAKSQIDVDSSVTLDSILSDFTFGYSVVYLGPSLSQDYEDGATFNRFKSGQDYKGDDTDYIGSYQVYHATRLSYQLTKDVSLSYSYTFQDDLHDVNYRSKNLDGSTSIYKREGGLSYNDQQMSMWIANVAETNLFYFNMGLVYQLPTTEGSEINEMKYGLGARPSINFKTPVAGLYTGINSEVLRLYYEKEQYDIDCGGTPCAYPVKNQTLTVTFSPYVNYSVSDKVLLKSSLVFDWDQDGHEVYTNKYNDNMIDIGNVGADYFLSKNVTLGSSLQFALEDPSVEKTAISFVMNLTI